MREVCLTEAQQMRVSFATEDTHLSSALSTFCRDHQAEVQPLFSENASENAAAALVFFECGGDFDLLRKWRREHSDTPLVVMLRDSTPAKLLQAAKFNPIEVLPVPMGDRLLRDRLTMIWEELLQLRSSARKDTPDLPYLLVDTPRMSELRSMIEKVATTSAPVLIEGESGAGKEIVARMIYAKSARSERPFVKLNCAAIPHDLLESELFGYEAGAFTGATRQKPGKFEQADSGTLFLDEIGEMHPALQAKLLHVLQDGEFSPLGAKRDIAVDVRVLCATNQLLERLVARGRFREDLLYRINVVTLHVPPLRERRDEIPLLALHFLEKYSALYSRPNQPLRPDLLQQMLEYSWPGNIRELENLIKRYIIFGSDREILRELNVRTVPKPDSQTLSPLPVEMLSGGAEIDTRDSAIAEVADGNQNDLSDGFDDHRAVAYGAESANRVPGDSGRRDLGRIDAARRDQAQRGSDRTDADRGDPSVMTFYGNSSAVGTAAEGIGREVHDPAAEGTVSLLEIGRRAAWAAEKAAIQSMLAQTRWNRKESAKRLQVSYKALLNKLKQMQLENPRATRTTNNEH